ncbi:MAG: VanZ family protein [Chloroflexi bacterium]|nr:VanZ family protein [Chloroflexota bacterium]
MKPLRGGRWRWWPLLILWMVVIFVFSHQPKGAIPVFGVWDLLVKKGSHMAAYAVLAWLAYRAAGEGRWAAVWAVVFSVAYAISDEYHQSFVPDRNGTALDVFIDSIGAVMGTALARYRGQFRWGRTKLPGRRLPRDV